ncbi:MAG: DNA-binding protein [Saprospirales bacterium]|nr:DNA-binding protein [Saprospirales bacterium]
MEKIIVTTPKEIENIIEDIILRHKVEEKPITPSQDDVVLMSRKETAEMLGISLPTLSKHTKEGLIPSHRMGNRILYKRSEVIEAIQQRNFGKV